MRKTILMKLSPAMSAFGGKADIAITVLSSAARTSTNDFEDWIVMCWIGTVRFAIFGMISKPFDIRRFSLVASHRTEP
jgi:hypothetical protein